MDAPRIHPLPFDPARLRGLSARLVESHHRNNYAGAVRRRSAFEAAPDMIAGAVWRDPERVDEWAGEFAGSDVVVYCVHGHEVGRSTAARLREAGVNARFLAGGIEAWKMAGLPTQPR